MDRPLENSYWVVPGTVLAGEHPYDSDEPDTLRRLQRLLDAGIDSFLDLTHAGERPDYERYLPPDVEVLRSAIRDCAVPSDIAQMRAIQAHLRSALAAGKHVYVHCRAGIGSSPLPSASCGLAISSPIALRRHRPCAGRHQFEFAMISAS